MRAANSGASTSESRNCRSAARESTCGRCVVDGAGAAADAQPARTAAAAARRARRNMMVLVSGKRADQRGHALATSERCVDAPVSVEACATPRQRVRECLQLFRRVHAEEQPRRIAVLQRGTRSGIVIAPRQRLEQCARRRSPPAQAASKHTSSAAARSTRTTAPARGPRRAPARPRGYPISPSARMPRNSGVVTKGMSHATTSTEAPLAARSASRAQRGARARRAHRQQRATTETTLRLASRC